MSDRQNISEIKEEFWEELANSPYVMVGLEADQKHSIPMNAVLDRDADHCFWFYTSKDNRLAKGGPAMVQFASKGHDIFACVAGTLVEETDPEVIDRYWSNSVEAWYDQGRDDPNLLMLRFELASAEIWEADPGLKGIFKMLTGATMEPEDLGSHAKVRL